jgi:hypothetical protein
MGLCLYYLKDMRGWLSLMLQFTTGLSVFVVSAYLFDIGGIKQVVANFLKTRSDKQ